MSLTPKIIRYGILAGIAQALYVAAIIFFFFYVEDELNNRPEIVVGTMMLLLFVFSAALSGLIVFGYPVILIAQKEYKQALWTVGITLATLFTLLTLLISASIILSF